MARRFLELQDLEVRRRSREMGPDVAGEIDLLGLLVRDMAREAVRRITVLQVGANAGEGNDPVRQLILEELVEAILIEPAPAPFAKLQKLYETATSVHVAQFAVSSERGVLPFYILVDADGAPTRTGLSSIDRNRIEAALVSASEREGRPLRIERIDVEAMTIPDVLSHYGWSSVDVLVVDAEGIDDKIVRGAIDAGLRPSAILMEFEHLSVADFRAFARHLRKTGYRIARSGYNLLATNDPRLILHYSWQEKTEQKPCE